VADDVEAGVYQTGKADDVFALTVYRGDLYCVSNHRKNVFRYEGGQSWRNVGLDHRVISLSLYRGGLYALANGGPVYRYAGGTDWEYCGTPAGATQVYGSVTHNGRLYVGTWPEGEVFCYEGGEEWRCVGRVGYAREVMAMALHNGKAYLGSLPMANVWRMDGEGFSFVGNLDNAPVILRRVWSMANYQGGLYAGTLPSGKVWRLEAGRMATWDHRLPGGWHHVAAVKTAQALKLHLDGREVASAALPTGGHNLSNDRPLLVGAGAYEHFSGLLADVRVYRRALATSEILALCEV
jgi:hypothetical protein